MYVIWYKTNRITALVLVLPVMSMKHFSWGSPDLQTFYNPVDVLPFILLALSGRIFALAPTVLCREHAPGSDGSRKVSPLQFAILAFPIVFQPIAVVVWP